MSDFSIDKNIPIPTDVKKSRQQKYPLLTMDVNDSFLVPYKDGEDNATGMIRINNAIRHVTKKHNKEFLAGHRNLADHKETGIRVWRTK